MAGAAVQSPAEERLAQGTSILSDKTMSADEKYAKLASLFKQPLTMRVPLTPPSNKENGGSGGAMTPAEQLELITSNLQEVLDPQIMEDVLVKEKRPLRIYWGTATTGRPHCAYFVPLMQLASFLRAGCIVTILLADMHGFLDNLKAPIELVQYRAEYYRYVIIEMLKAIGVSTERLHFVLGSSYQLSETYQMDLLKLCTSVTMHDARRAGAEVVKQVENATLSGLIYPLMQALDEQYLGVDIQFGGVDQRKIFTLAKEILPRIGYRERAHLMNPMVPGLTGGKMSASDPNSKLDVLDEPDKVAAKIKKAVAAPKIVEENGLLSFVEHVLLPASKLRTGKAEFIVERREGGKLVYEHIFRMHEDYRLDILNPQNLKAAVTKALNELLAPVQAAFKADPEWQAVMEKAYPPEEKKVKEKKVKNKGTRHPGAAASGDAAGAASEDASPVGTAAEGQQRVPTTVSAQGQHVIAQADGSVKGPDKAQVDLGQAGAGLEQLSLANKQVQK